MQQKKSGNVITNDPIDYITEQEHKGQQIVRTMGEAGLFLSDPELLLTISEADWPIRDRISYMKDKELLYINSNVDGYTDWINGLKKRQNLSTGIVPILSEQLQMRGNRYSDMVQSNESTSAEISTATKNKMAALFLVLLLIWTTIFKVKKSLLKEMAA